MNRRDTIIFGVLLVAFVTLCFAYVYVNATGVQ